MKDSEEFTQLQLSCGVEESFPQWLTAYPEARQKRGRAWANLGEVAAGRPVGKKQLFFWIGRGKFFFFGGGGSEATLRGARFFLGLGNQTRFPPETAT